MQQQIKWKRGEFHTFYATMKIRVGGQDPVDIEKGDEIEYDGSTCKYAGREFAQPNLRGAVVSGWLTLDEDGEVPATVMSHRKVARSQTKNTDLSRVQRHGDRMMDTDSLDEETVSHVDDRGAVMDQRTGRGHLDARHNRRQAARTMMSEDSTAGTFRGLEVTGSELDEQDARPVSRIKSPAKLKVDVLANPGEAQKIARRSYDTGYGRSQSKKKQVVREGVTIDMNVGNVEAGVVEDGDEDQGTVVGQVRHSSAQRRTSEGVSIEDTSGTAEARASRKSKKKKAAAKPAKKTAPAKKAAKKAAKAAPAKTNGKKAEPSDGNGVNVGSNKLRVALRICKDFPQDWNFFGKADDKMARIKELGASPELLDAAYAVESATMKKALEKKYPKQFAQ